MESGSNQIFSDSGVWLHQVQTCNLWQRVTNFRPNSVSKSVEWCGSGELTQNKSNFTAKRAQRVDPLTEKRRKREREEEELNGWIVQGIKLTLHCFGFFVCVYCSEQFFWAISGTASLSSIHLSTNLTHNQLFRELWSKECWAYHLGWITDLV